MASQSSTSQAAPAKPVSAAAASSSRQATSSSHAGSSGSCDWQTVKTSGARAKGRGQSAGPPNGPCARAASAYASASPLDFQEPWRDEPEPSSQNRRSFNTDLQQKPRQTVAPTVSDNELPEDWEEAASAVESSDESLGEAAAAEPAPEAAALPVDDEASIEEHSAGTAANRLSDSAATDLTQGALSVHTLAHGSQAEPAAAAPPASHHTDEARAETEAASTAARSDTDEGAAEAVTRAGCSQEGASGHADERQETFACAAQESEASAGVANVALPSAGEGMLQSVLALSESQPASEAAAAPSAEPEGLTHHLAVVDTCVAPGKAEAHAPTANECHGCDTSPQDDGATSLLLSGEEHQPGHCASTEVSAAEAEQDVLTSMTPSSSSDAKQFWG